MITRLKHGEALPPGEPKRYKDRAGYVRLRWHVGGGDSVEILEHRLVAGALPEEHVHHLNHDTSDNRPENLVVLTQSEHARVHGDHNRRFDVGVATMLYEKGLSTPQIGVLLGVDPSNVYRRLKDAGVKLRSVSESQRMHIDLGQVKRLYDSGLRINPIADRMGVSRAVVRRAFVDLGLPIAKPGRPRAS